MSSNNRVQEIFEIIKQNYTRKELTEILDDYHVSDIADVLEMLSKDERRRLYKSLSLDRLSDMFSYIEDATEYFEEMEIRKAASIVNNMDADDVIDVLENIDEDMSEKLTQLMDKETAEDVKLIQSFPETQIGSKMTTNFIAIAKGLGVRQAMKEMVRQAEENDNVYIIYVCNEDGTLYGTLDIKDLIVAREHTNLEQFINTGFPYIYADAEIADCLEDIKGYEVSSLPVLDRENKLIGIITPHDIIEVVGEELEEDYAKLAGLTESEDIDETIFQSIKKRFPWLILLLFLGLGISSVVGVFEAVVQQIAVVVCFQSLILGMAGNVGTQSLAVTIRVLMEENIERKRKTGLIFKEIKIGFINGLLLGITSFIFVGLYLWLLKQNEPFFAFCVSGCVGIALIVAMVIASAVGTTVPMFFKKINIDPAVASGPLITTVNDLVAVLSYYGIAWFLLIQILHI